MTMNWKTMQKALDRDVVLERLGLERRTPTGDFFTGLGLFSVGVLVGAGLGLMFAPKRGEEIRSALNEAWRSRGRGAQDFQRDLGVEGSVSPATTTGGGH
ncbi:MAG TPA: YtxH domain-containing protein [Anaeromyxobacter sp.]